MLRTNGQGQHLKKAAVTTVATALGALGLVVVSPAPPASAADVNVDLYAVTGTTVLPGGESVPVWGYTTDGTPVSTPGGPTITVDAGQSVDITVHNTLDVSTSLLLRGQEMVPDLDGIVPTDSKTYSFTASTPGTYLYEAGLLPGAEYQTPMGLYGALVVNSSTGGQAYDDPSTAFDQDEVLVLSEIDPNLNGAADPAAFDMRKYQPKYSLINGKAHPDADDIVADASSTVLLRYVNAGTQYRSMAALGAGQQVIALDGSPLSYSRRYVAETFGPGQTADALVTAPEATVDETRVPIYDGSLLLHNSNVAGTGGMLTYITVAGTGDPSDTVGPPVTAIAYSGDTLTATLDDADTGGSSVQAAEYFVDTVGDEGTGTAMDGAFTSSTEEVSAVDAVPPGHHIYYVRGQDSQGNWGVLSSVLVDGPDVTGPNVITPKLVRTPTNGSVDVQVRATADDTETGGSTISAAEYFIGGDPGEGNGTPMNVNKPDVTASIVGTIAQADVPAEGAHLVGIRAQDSAGQWGAVVETELVVDSTGPDASGVDAQPDPNNGTIPFNPSTPAVRVDATLTDPLSGGVNTELRKGELFIDTIGANNQGIVLAPVDGAFDSSSEEVYADIPLATISQLTNGVHTIYVHGRDLAKNWGDASLASTTLTIDKVGPQVTALDASPNPTAGASDVSLTATANDNLTSVTAAQWWIGSVSPANRNAMAVSGSGPWSLSATIDVSSMSPGSYRVRVRAQDAVGNWGPRTSVILVVN